MNRPSPSPLVRRVLSTASAAVCVGGAFAQVQTELTFSVDWQGPLMGLPNSTTGAPINEADLLFQPELRFGPGRPGTRIPGSFLQRYSQCVGHQPGFACGVEIDALSLGVDARLRSVATYRFDVLYSVDEHATGIPTTQPRTVFREALADDAAADIFMGRFSGSLPFGPQPRPHVAVVDGNGEQSSSGALYPGLGLAEPTRPTPTVPELGDNLDALDLGPPPQPGARLFFSLEGGLFDPREPFATITNSAALQPDPTGQGFNGADVLVVDVQGLVLRYAGAGQLGLSTAGLDDIDALVVVENGVPGYQPSVALYDWVPAQGTTPRDLVLFSVRRGSAVIGQLDSLLGIPITEGDVLAAPIGGGSTGARPAIVIAAEALGLATQRGQAQNAGDELDGLDVRDDTEDPIKDCNGNGIEDAYDITNGTSPDVDGNGIPDECEDPGDAFCDCDTQAEAPCGNTGAPGEGCRNNTGVGGRLVGTGTSSMETDSLVLTATQLTPNTFGVVFLGAGVASVFPPASNGRLCVVGGGGSGLYRTAVAPTGPSGTLVYGPGILGAVSTLPAPPPIVVGSTWGFQVWFRDLGGPCSGGASNLTNGWRVTFTL